MSNEANGANDLPKKFRIANNQSGFSLMEIMVAVGLAGLMTLASVSVLKMQSVSEKRLNTQDSARDATMDIANLLSNQAACKNTFLAKNPNTNGTTGTAITEIRDSNNLLKFAVGTSYGNNSVVLSGISLGGVGIDTKTGLPLYTVHSSTSGTALVRVTWTPKGTATGMVQGASSYVRFFFINTVTSSTTLITSCGATATSATSAIRQGGADTCTPGSQIFNYTGTDQSFTVPPACTEIEVKLWGAGGGAGSGAGMAPGGNGGGGGFVKGTIGVTPGEVLTVKIGGGGLGGTADISNDPGGAGGGASSLLRGATVLAIAGGGGGGSHGESFLGRDGGAGGGTNGVAGSAAAGNCTGATGGGGGAPGAGGTAGSGYASVQGHAGSSLQGGHGELSASAVIAGGYGGGGNGGFGGVSMSGSNGGGGGGGYYGGGSGGRCEGDSSAAGGGGGGSGFVDVGASGVSNFAGTGRTPGGSTDTDYANAAGQGATGMPDSAGESGNPGRGRISWSQGVIVGDNLGNHKMEMNLNLNNFYISGGGATGLFIDTAGQVAIGHTVPAASLDVAGGVKISDDTVTGCGSGTAGALRWATTPNPDEFQYCNGTAWTTLLPPPSGNLTENFDFTRFTGSGTWTKPSTAVDNELVFVQLWGGGGGAGGTGRGGGGGGGYNQAVFRASDLTSTVAVTVGAGGNGGGGSAAGNPGGTSSFGTYVYAYGGGGGQGTTNGTGGGGGGTLSAGSTAGASSGAGGAPDGGTSVGSGSGVSSSSGGGSGGYGTTGTGGSSFFGGGGGGGGPGGASVYGGGGGSGTTGTAGTSIFGGNGGASTVAGSVPGGGGGSFNGGGAPGEVRVWVLAQSPPTPACGLQKIFLTTTGSLQSWTVPAAWNNASNTIEVIGGGGGGAAQKAATGGGGGAYSKITNLSLTAGASVSYRVGAGGAAKTCCGNGNAGEDTWFNGATFGASSVGAKGGAAGLGSTSTGGVLAGPAGGAAGSGIGTVKNSGGAGGGGYSNGTYYGAGGGGGGAGPNGNGGGGGGKASAGTNDANGGGGGNGGGATAANTGSATGSNGGNNIGGTGGGAGGASDVDGTNGTNGGGGGGGGNNAFGGAGGAGTEFDSTHGSGGGGGGANGSNTGGAGALYGGGGGGGSGSTPDTGGAGAQGVIVITYTAADQSGCQDNLGNHIMTKNLTTGAYYLSGDGGSEGLYISSNGSVGVNTATPRARLEVAGAAISAAAPLNASTAIDFSTGNLQYTNASCASFTLANMVDGGAYSLAIKGTSSATCSFSASGKTINMPADHAATTAGTQTVYTFVVVGTQVYVSWIPGYAVAPTCGGTSVGGYCWYLGAAGASCTTTCATHGGYDAATLTYAGSAGTLAHCDAVLEALSGSAKSTFDISGCTDAVGCDWDTGGTPGWQEFRCTTPATTESAGDSFGGKRACACLN